MRFVCVKFNQSDFRIMVIVLAHHLTHLVNLWLWAGRALVPLATELLSSIPGIVLVRNNNG